MSGIWRLLALFSLFPGRVPRFHDVISNFFLRLTSDLDTALGGEERILRLGGGGGGGGGGGTMDYGWNTLLVCMGLGPSILSDIDKCPSYSGPLYQSDILRVE